MLWHQKRDPPGSTGSLLSPLIKTRRLHGLVDVFKLRLLIGLMGRPLSLFITLSGLPTWIREELITLFKRFSSDLHTVGHGATRTRRAYRATDSSHEGSLRNMDTMASTKTFLDDVRLICFGKFHGLHVTYAVSDGGASFAQVP